SPVSWRPRTRPEWQTRRMEQRDVPARTCVPPNHLDLNVSDLRRSEGFYSSLAEQLGWRELERGEGWVSIGTGSFYVTLVQTQDRFREAGYHRKAVGVNHLAF